MSNNMTSMCQSYFGLIEAPFSIAPDPRYLFMSDSHQEALATLLFGLGGDGGFVLLTGDVGAGKTTICRCLLEQIPEACDVAYIFNPKLTVVELLSTICDEFGIAYPPGNTSIKLFVDFINAYLLEAHAKGRRAVLIIDEAQNLSADVLEQMRLLTNLETHQRKLLQIILLGQPELATMLECPELRQLAQRIIARYHLGPLAKAEVKSYIRHRLDVSGAKRQLFPNSLMGTVYSLSRGVPRVINTLCDRALLGAYVQSKERVDRATLLQAAREVFPQPMARRQNLRLFLMVSFVLIAGSALATALYQKNQRQDRVMAVQASLPEAAKPPAPALSAITPASRVIPRPVKNTESITATQATLEWPTDLPKSSSKILAYRALLQAWGIDDREGIDMCSQVESAGLSCKTGRGGLNELRYLNRPAILHMHDNQGQKFYATLTKLDEKAATFVIGNKTIKVALGALAFQWSGDYTLLWRSFPYLHRNMLMGDRGPSVGQLSKLLALAQGGKKISTKDTVFDTDLMRQVKQFQLAQGLVPDGIAGTQTLTRLSGVADQAAPKLSAGLREK